MTFPEPAMQERASTDSRDQIDRRPAVIPDELAGRRDRLAERAGDRVREADRPRKRERHVALGTGERPHPQPGGPFRRPDLDPRRSGAETIIPLGILVRRWIEEHPHKLIIALGPRRPAGV
jgi:hypothetical protein